MKVKIPKQLEKIIEKFENQEYEIYIVGGAVRDIVMGRNTYDWDLTTNAAPDEILKLLKNQDPFYDNNFGTVGVPNTEEDERPYEITTFRTEEGYSDSRRPDKVSWGKSLKEDLTRRDFTVNAMALKKDKDDFEVIDYFGGLNDIKKKIIKAVGNPDERFSEDGLRMMRAIRIASELTFKIEDDTFDAIKSNSSLIDKIAKERVRDELFKILKSDNPMEGIKMLIDSEIMGLIVPEIEKMFGVEQKSPGRHHIYDVGTHALLSLKHCTNADPVVRFAALIHDIGKPRTYKKLETGVITFYNHEVVGAKMASDIADRLKFSAKDKRKLATLVRWHLFSVNENQTDSAIRRFIKNVGLDLVEDMLQIRIADRLGSGSTKTSWRFEKFKERIIEVQKQPFSISDLKISGHDVMKTLNIKPGPRVGEILKKLFEKVEKKEIENTKEDLLKEIKKD